MQFNQLSEWFPQVVVCLCWQVGGGKWHLPAPFFLEETPCDPYLSRHALEMSKSLSLLSAPGSFQIAGFILYLHGLFVCCLFTGGDPAS